MNDCPGSTDGERHIGAAETIQRLHAELLAEQIRSLIQFESVAVIGRSTRNFANQFRVRIRDQDLRRTEASQFVFEGLKRVHLRNPEFAGANIKEGQPEQELETSTRSSFR